ncbi:unnamed protein product [Camellia sinensis]
MGVVTEVHHQTPFLLQSSLALSPHDQPIHRTGNEWTAVAHIITGVIGSGVLSLAWCMAQLGWIGGSFSMLFFAFITLISAFLLSNCYRSPYPELGPTRNHSYLEAVHFNLGERSSWACGLCVNINLYGIGIAYTITSAISMSNTEIKLLPQYGHEVNCEYGDTYYMLIFGLSQIVSFIYSFIALALGLVKVTVVVGIGLAGDGVIKGNIAGVSTSTTLEKVWLVSQALGDIAFAYPYSIILIEIQLHITNEESQVNVIENCKNTPKDTLKSPPPENEIMKKASTIAVCITTFFYLCCGGFGYAAFGDSTPGSLLTGYQVFSQPLFALVDKWFARKFPNSGFVNYDYTLKLPFFLILRLNLLRLCFRTTYVASTTVIEMIFPYFNQVLGVLGALNFWPLSIYFPMEMYFMQTNIEAWSTKWIALHAFSIVCLLMTMFALVGSIEGLTSAKLS